MPSSSTRILLMTVVLLAVLSGQVTVAQSIRQETSTVSSVTPSTEVWRRTAQGWQQTNSWPSRADRPLVRRDGGVHPLVLAALIGLISIGGLIGFGPQRRKAQ